jgi:hypothetical protein
MSILENIYLNSDNTASWIISDENGPIAFVDNATTKIEIYLDDILITSDTSELTFANGGLITLDLGMNAELVGNQKYPVILKVFDAIHINGQVLMHPAMGQSCANIKALPASVTP